MKKTVLGIITIVMLVVMLTTSVNAASISADKTKMEKEEIVTVTIKTDEKVESMQFDLKFDTAKYEFVEGSIKTDLETLDYNIKEGVLTVSAFDTSVTTDTLTLQFKALEDGEKIPFEISNTEFSNDEAMANATVDVTIAEKQEPAKPVDPEKKPTQDDKKPVEDDKRPAIDNEKPVEDDKKLSTDDKKPAENNNGDKYFDEDGNEIPRIPQAGSLVPSVVFGAALLGVIVVAGYKMINKSK